MKTIRKQDKFQDDVAYLEFQALRHELGYCQAVSSDEVSQTYDTNKGRIVCTKEKPKDPDYKILVKGMDGEPWVTYAKFI